MIEMYKKAFKQTAFPRYRGFNLIDMFCSETSTLNCGRSQGYYDDRDFRTIAKWGFNFVRLPLSYRIWSDVNNPYFVYEEKIKPLDEAINCAIENNLNVSVCLHRIPGYCVNDDEPIKEPYSLWEDEEAASAAEFQWKMLAKRYKNISADNLSFNLINEPRYSVASSKIAEISIRLSNAIRSISPNRTIILDGTFNGSIPPTEHMRMYEKNCGYSCRGYSPGNITHYGISYNEEPSWPNGGIYRMGSYSVPYGLKEMDDYYNIWAAHAEIFNVGVMCGEIGCFNQTPHQVCLDWFEASLKSLKKHNIGYALWNFKGPFGVVNSGRKDVIYKKEDGYLVDDKLLKLLMQY